MAWLIGLVSVVLAAAITGTYGQTGLNTAQKQQFVDAHNSLRGSVKPAATKMKTMVRVQLYSCHFKVYTSLLRRRHGTMNSRPPLNKYIWGTTQAENLKHSRILAGPFIPQPELYPITAQWFGLDIMKLLIIRQSGIIPPTHWEPGKVCGH